MIYYTGLLFLFLLILYVLAYKDVSYKVELFKAERERTGYISKEYKLHIIVSLFKILFFCYAFIGMFTNYSKYFFIIVVLILVTSTKWHYQINKIIYFIISCILFSILFSITF